MIKYLAIALIFAVAMAALVVYAAEKGQTKQKIDPAAELKASIERGKALFNDPKLGTTGHNCSSCHTAGGTKMGKMGDMPIKPFDSLGCKYPMYFPMAKKVLTLDQVVNFCITMPLKGKALAADDQRLTDLVAYCASVTPVKEKKETGK